MTRRRLINKVDEDRQVSFNDLGPPKSDSTHTIRIEEHLHPQHITYADPVIPTLGAVVNFVDAVLRVIIGIQLLLQVLHKLTTGNVEVFWYFVLESVLLLLVSSQIVVVPVTPLGPLNVMDGILGIFNLPYPIVLGSLLLMVSEIPAYTDNLYNGQVLEILIGVLLIITGAVYSFIFGFNPPPPTDSSFRIRRWYRRRGGMQQHSRTYIRALTHTVIGLICLSGAVLFFLHSMLGPSLLAFFMSVYMAVTWSFRLRVQSVFHLAFAWLILTLFARIPESFDQDNLLLLSTLIPTFLVAFNDLVEDVGMDIGATITDFVEFIVVNIRISRLVRFLYGTSLLLGLCTLPFAMETINKPWLDLEVAPPNLAVFVTDEISTMIDMVQSWDEILSEAVRKLNPCDQGSSIKEKRFPVPESTRIITEVDESLRKLRSGVATTLCFRTDTIAHDEALHLQNRDQQHFDFMIERIRIGCDSEEVDTVRCDYMVETVKQLHANCIKFEEGVSSRPAGYEKDMEQSIHNMALVETTTEFPRMDGSCIAGICQAFIATIISGSLLSLIPFVGTVASAVTQFARITFTIMRKIFKMARAISRNRKKFASVRRVVHRLRNLIQTVKSTVNTNQLFTYIAFAPILTLLFYILIAFYRRDPISTASRGVITTIAFTLAAVNICLGLFLLFVEVTIQETFQSFGDSFVLTMYEGFFFAQSTYFVGGISLLVYSLVLFLPGDNLYGLLRDVPLTMGASSSSSSSVRSRIYKPASNGDGNRGFFFFGLGDWILAFLMSLIPAAISVYGILEDPDMFLVTRTVTREVGEALLDSEQVFEIADRLVELEEDRQIECGIFEAVADQLADVVKEQLSKVNGLAERLNGFEVSKIQLELLFQELKTSLNYDHLLGFVPMQSTIVVPETLKFFLYFPSIMVTLIALAMVLFQLFPTAAMTRDKWSQIGAKSVLPLACAGLSLCAFLMGMASFMDGMSLPFVKLSITIGNGLYYPIMANALILIVAFQLFVGLELPISTTNTIYGFNRGTVYA